MGPSARAAATQNIYQKKKKSYKKEEEDHTNTPQEETNLKIGHPILFWITVALGAWCQ